MWNFRKVLAELESFFHQMLTTTKPAKLDNEDPVLVAVHGLARFNKFYRISLTNLFRWES